MSFEEYSNNKKKKKTSSFEEWSNANRGISKKQEEEDEKKRKAYLSQHGSRVAAEEDDIAPIGGNKESWFKSGGFSDGVDGVGDFFGDLGQTVGGTVGDLGVGVLKGAGRLVEGVVDLGTYGVAGVADMFGADDFAEKTKKVAQYSATDEWTKGATDFLDRYSVLGNKADMVSEGLGQVGAIILTGGAAAAGGMGAGGVAALTTGITGLSGMGTGMTQAYEEGASDKDAVLYGLGAGSVEAATELLFGGLGKGVKALGLSRGIGGLDDIFAKKLSSAVTRAITNESVQKVAGNTIEAAVKASGEGAEEVLSGIGSAVMKKLTYEDDETLQKLIEDENLLEQFVVGAITSSIAQGADFVKANQSGRDMVTGYTNDEQAVIDKVVEQRVAEQEKDGKKLTTREISAIEEQVQNDMERGQLDIDVIEEVLGGDDYTAYKAEADAQEAAKAEYEELAGIKKSDLTTKQEKRLAELEEVLGDGDKQANRNNLRWNMRSTVDKKLKGSKLAETYKERVRKGLAFTADLSKYTGKQREAVERAINSGVLNDTYRSHELVDVLSKIEAAKGIAFDYTNNAKLKESIFAVDGKVVNGYANKNTGTVTINVQSAKAWQSVVGHEITHVLEGTEAYGELQKAMYAYAESKGELETRRASLTKLYEEIGADVDSELTADLIGDYLFTDKDFVDHLVGNRTLFQKIYDEIKYLWNVATGKEKADIEKVKHEFDRAWKEYSAKGTEAKVDSEGDGDTQNTEAVKVMEGGAAVKYSLSTWTPETQKKVRANLVKAGHEAEKVDKWIDDLNGVAAVIASDKDRLDFEAADNQVMLKNNQEYIKTLDASTLCAKRLQYQGTFNAIQHRLPDTVLTSDDLIELQNMLKEHGYEAPCSVCYVESRRRHLGKFAQGWLEEYDGEYKPRLDEVTTSDGLEELRHAHPQAYKDFVDAMNAKGSANPKVVQLRTEYRNDIMSLTPKQIEKIEAIGGLRVQSFSDFETPHLLDMMQAVMDMSAKGLTSQAYTKVPNFAWVFGDTGIKINLSLIAEGNGFDSDGNLAFSSVEGMDINEAMAVRDAYPENVGTIIVGANDAHILACMADDRIDYIIPFHRSGWGKNEMDMMGLGSYDDYSYGQSEHDLATGKKLANLYPPDYWDYNVSGKENAERYLKLCAQTGREPKFSNFLVNNGDGSYSLQPDGSTDGYWKTLIDFKMYDNDGNGAKQQKVQPNFNMEEAYRVLNEYEGGANSLPVANDVVEKFVAKHYGNIAPVQYSLSAETDDDYMSAVERGDTEAAQTMVDNAAKAAGYTRTLYHGTPSKFNVFGFGRTGIFTTNNFDVAKTYGDNVMTLYGKEGAKVLTIDAKESPHWGIEVSKDVLDFSEYPLMRGKERYSTNDISLIAFREGYDVVVIKNVYDNYSAASGNTENGLGTDVVYKDPNQVKSSEAVTYDDNGNVIPLSERFNENSKDMRFSLSEEDEEYAPTGNYSTPLKELALPVKTDAESQHTAKTSQYVAKPVEETVEESPEVVAKSVRIANGERSNELLYESLDNYPMQTIEQKVAEKIRAVQGEIADKQDLRRESWEHYESQISDLRAKYNAKKNKNTKGASKILASISRLERLKASREAELAKNISDLEARVQKMSDPQYIRAMYKRSKMEADAKWAADLLGDTTTWVDKKIGLQYATNTERRNFRDIVKDESGKADIARADAIDDALGGQYNREEAEKKRELTKVRQKYADMKITRAEDAYIQMLGELRHNPDSKLTEEFVQKYYELYKDKIDKAKVDRVIELARQDYDDLINRVNAELKRQGMREIPYRQGYFPHFTDPKQNFVQKLLNWKVQNDEIPTSIAGLTETFRPTKSWQSFDKTRYSDETDYSFMKGFDSYSDGALDWIYHMDTLQKRRAVENHIRYTHSDEGIKARIKEVYAAEDIDATEAQARIEGILNEANNPLNNFIQDFTTHTNILAGKKNTLDRTLEQWTNRHIYSVMTNVQNRLSANMVLANVRSALTNFIPITQSWAQVSPARSLQATAETIANAIKDDGTVEKSTFLTNRLREADRLYKTTWDKILDKAGIMFEVVDNFSSQVIWRSKYNQNLAQGMSEAEAIQNADQFAENVMAGRSKGNEPTLFNAKNPFVKAFTAFQLEVTNQYGYLFKDVPNDLKAETNHWRLNLAKGYTTAFIGAYVYNALLEKVTGSEAALDPIGIIEELLRDLGLLGEDDEKEPKEALESLKDNVLEQMPFVGGYLGGGRFPISNALPIKELVTGKDSYGNEVSRWETIKEAAPYTLFPFGYGQIKKTVQGLGMFSDDHPVTGSYTDSGKLRFPVEDTPANRVQAAIFGQYASANAREYFDNEYAPLAEKQIQEYADLEVPIREYREIREGLSGLSKLEEKLDYISDLDLPVAKKNILANNVADRKEPIDLADYEDYGSLEEFDFASKNPEKYAFLQDRGVSYSEYAASEDSKKAYNWAYENPDGYAVSRAVTDDVVEYRQYAKELNDIKADKDAEGKSINGSRKEKVIQYINNLDADYYTKIILLKSEYPSEDSYNTEIIEYLNGRNDLTYEDRVSILAGLGFRVTADGQIYAD